MPQLQELLAPMVGSVGSSSSGDTTPTPCPWPPLSPPGQTSPCGAHKMRIPLFPSLGADALCLVWINVCKAVGSAAEMGAFRFVLGPDLSG